MNILKQLPRIFSLTAHKWCKKCNNVKSMDHYSHGMKYVNPICNSCRGIANPPEIDQSKLNVPYSYFMSIAPFLPENQASRNRYMVPLRTVVFLLMESECKGCQNEHAYPFSDEFAKEPLSIFNSVSTIKNAHWYCDDCAKKKPNEAPPPPDKMADFLEREERKNLRMYEKFASPIKRERVDREYGVSLEDLPERKDCPTCKKSKPALEFAIKRSSFSSKVTYYIKSECHDCRKERAAQYARDKRKYIPILDDQDSRRIRNDIEQDFRVNPCLECGQFHSEEKPLFYYDHHTLELLETSTRPYAVSTTIRLHKVCRKEVIKLRML